MSNFKQSTLVTELLKRSYEAHNAIADVEALQMLYNTKMKPSPSMLQELLFHICTHVYMASMKALVQKKILSQAIASKMCKSGLNLAYLQLAYQRGGDDGVRSLLKEKIAGRVRVTCAIRTLNSVVAFLGGPN